MGLRSDFFLVDKYLKRRNIYFEIKMFNMIGNEFGHSVKFTFEGCDKKSIGTIDIGDGSNAVFAEGVLW